MSVRSSIAYHEAGHAAIAVYWGIQPLKIALVAGKSNFGIFRLTPEPKQKKPAWPMPLRKKDRIEKKIMVCLAGGIAQRIHKPRGYRQANDLEDRMQAFDLASVITAQQDDEAIALVEYFRVKTKNLLEDPSNWGAVDVLAKEIIRSGELSRKRITELAVGAEPLQIRE